MNVIQTPLKDCVIIEPKVFGDSRGFSLRPGIKKNMKMQESKVILYRITAHVRVEMFCVDCISRKRNPRVN
ncbi:dTDP-6-deoxy-D-glucose-3,5 epimerase [Escherichia coli]|uniref:dTDP-6-deoxy-D-glucose-3,5 epimerase n=1 Tax=Escherichia coli TaxID=562 RepID=A0A376WZD7_ECOLX|nr:dTDP-6-deoxy-D-glucose-3,5 epimerase [Escherichia coli]